MALEQVRDSLRKVATNAGNDYKRGWANELADAIDAAIKQREQDTKDAARYRWLRNKSGRDGTPYIRCDDPPFKPMDYWITAGTADSCIDRAMAKESGNG
jgi:hypothetical protein